MAKLGCEETHGNPFRYCSCGWIEEQESEGAKRTNDIENRFAFHAATTEEKKNEHSSARNTIKTVAHYLNGIVPEGREKAVMLTKLEEAMFWANAAIARNK